jgi:hypothetical protein
MFSPSAPVEQQPVHQVQPRQAPESEMERMLIKYEMDNIPSSLASIHSFQNNIMSSLALFESFVVERFSDIEGRIAEAFVGQTKTNEETAKRFGGP